MIAVIDLADYDYALPPERIAQEPAAERDGARLLVLERAGGARRHAAIPDLPGILAPGDLLVVNETRVLPARLRGRKASGGAAEALLLGPAGTPGHYRALLRSRGHARPGQRLRFARGERGAEAGIACACADGEVVLCFDAGVDPYALGETPLPPYIRRPRARADDARRYQTTYARVPGAVAAPTAGLHLSERLLARLAEGGVERAAVVLHIGPGTFRPLRPADLERRTLPRERFELSARSAAQIAAARARGSRVVAVGTSTARVLESCADADGQLRPGAGETDLFLVPGSPLRVVDALLTNFHLPRSSLLLLVAALAGREPLLAAYAEAIERGYRFYSYGDAMLIL